METDFDKTLPRLFPVKKVVDELGILDTMLRPLIEARLSELMDKQELDTKKRSEMVIRARTALLAELPQQMPDATGHTPYEELQHKPGELVYTAVWLFCHWQHWVYTYDTIPWIEVRARFIELFDELIEEFWRLYELPA